jgi:SAM-dependent methyltransferase
MDTAIELSKTHALGQEHLQKADVQTEFALIKQRLLHDYGESPEQADELIALLEELAEFPLGRFLIKNQGGLSGYWTYYLIYDYRYHTISHPLEKFIVESSPAVLATRERFHHFKAILQKSIRNHMTVCSLPCGVMGELLQLEIDRSFDDVTFVGLDLDESCFPLAQQLAAQFDCQQKLLFRQQDAWQFNERDAFDIITSNGLNIYEADDTKVVQLYRLFFQALKPGGKFIGSHLSLPPQHPQGTEWTLDKLDQAAALRAQQIFATVLQATWTNFRSQVTTKSQLEQVGFTDVEFVWDKCKMFYTFVATKAAV